MCGQITKAFVAIQDRKMQRALHRDEEGLSLLAYALGAAVIVAPIAILLLNFGSDAVADAEASVDAAIAAS